MEIDLTYFENEIRDLITFTPDWVYYNIEESFTRGTELQVSIHPSEGLEVISSYTYMIPKDEETHDDLPRRPRNLGSVNLNYRFLGRTAETAGANRIALGHTANDQAETVLMRLMRGAGPSGLSGATPGRRPGRPRPRSGRRAGPAAASRERHGTERDRLRGGPPGRPPERGVITKE